MHLGRSDVRTFEVPPKGWVKLPGNVRYTIMDDFGIPIRMCVLERYVPAWAPEYVAVIPRALGESKNGHALAALLYRSDDPEFASAVFSAYHLGGLAALYMFLKDAK